MPAVDDTSFAAAKKRVEIALGFVNSLTRAHGGPPLVRIKALSEMVSVVGSGGLDRVYILINACRTIFPEVTGSLFGRQHFLAALDRVAAMFEQRAEITSSFHKPLTEALPDRLITHHG
jgi:hypothetical protein